MAKLYMERLKRKYGAFGWTGRAYRRLMELIIGSNHENIARSVLRRSDQFYRDRFRALQKTTTGQLKVPPMEELLPRRQVYLRKGAEQGIMITDALRDRLSHELRKVVRSYMEAGKNTMQYQRGAERGRMNPEIVGQFRDAITKVFQGYVKGHGGELPPNINTIAETETRSVISDVKNVYAEELVRRNPGRLAAEKTWRHNDKLSPDGRHGHELIDGRTIPMNERFEVPLYRKVKGKNVLVATHRMAHPHDPTAPAEQVINCRCECDYVMRVIPARKVLAPGRK